MKENSEIKQKNNYKSIYKTKSEQCEGYLSKPRIQRIKEIKQTKNKNKNLLCPKNINYKMVQSTGKACLNRIG